MEKLKVPEKNVKIINNKKVIYLGDYMLSRGCNTLEEEFEKNVKNVLNTLGLEFSNVEYWENPNLDSVYDILFFDWGGASIGNSMLDHICRYIVAAAEKYPNRQYVVVSSFTKYAMEDAIKYFNGNINHNIFLNEDQFCEYFKKIENIN